MSMRTNKRESKSVEIKTKTELQDQTNIKRVRLKKKNEIKKEEVCESVCQRSKDRQSNRFKMLVVTTTY